MREIDVGLENRSVARLVAGFGLAAALSGVPLSATPVCSFDVEALSFVGSQVEQATCLLRPVRKFAHLGEALARLPDGLAGLPGEPVAISRELLREHLVRAGVSEEEVGGALDRPLSRADTNDPSAPPALYFVIHDTSTPNFEEAELPDEINTAEWRHNALQRFDRGGESKAHVFINRVGESLTAVDFGTAWRATRLEVRQLGTVSRGRFLHVELIQPRRSDPSGPDRNDAVAPQPGFTDAQLERLALVYVAASVRGGRWLIPAFHAVVDSGIAGAHDDPQNFDLERWSRLVGELLAELRDDPGD